MCAKSFYLVFVVGTVVIFIYFFLCCCIVCSVSLSFIIPNGIHTIIYWNSVRLRKTNAIPNDVEWKTKQIQNKNSSTGNSQGIIVQYMLQRKREKAKKSGILTTSHTNETRYICYIAKTSMKRLKTNKQGSKRACRRKNKVNNVEWGHAVSHGRMH